MRNVALLMVLAGLLSGCVFPMGFGHHSDGGERGHEHSERR
jgi:hypothetical protein